MGNFRSFWPTPPPPSGGPNQSLRNTQSAAGINNTYTKRCVLTQKPANHPLLGINQGCMTETHNFARRLLTKSGNVMHSFVLCIIFTVFCIFRHHANSGPGSEYVGRQTSAARKQQARRGQAHRTHNGMNIQTISRSYKEKI